MKDARRTPLVLLAGEDRGAAEVMSRALGLERRDLLFAHDPDLVLRITALAKPDAVFVDLEAFHGQPLRVLRPLRRRTDGPLLLLATSDSIEACRAGLDAGADDYVLKPLQAADVRWRLELVRQRRAAQRLPLEVAGLRIDAARHEVTRGARRIDLTPRELSILQLLAEHAEEVISKQTIFERVWLEQHHGDLNVVEQHISSLRDKLERGGEPRLLHTLRGVGYVLRAPATD